MLNMLKDPKIGEVYRYGNSAIIITDLTPKYFEFRFIGSDSLYIQPFKNLPYRDWVLDTEYLFYKALKELK